MPNPGELFEPMDTCPNMHVVLLYNAYYSHGRIRQGYRDRKGQWMGVNADGTEGLLRFDPTGWMLIPGDRP